MTRAFKVQLVLKVIQVLLDHKVQWVQQVLRVLPVLLVHRDLKVIMVTLV